MNKLTRSWKVMAVALLFCTGLSACLHYSTRETSLSNDIKTVRVNYIDNKARIVNPQLSPQLTERLRQKINGNTNKTMVQGDADLDIYGTITDYSIGTSAISENRSATNRINITVHVKLVNKIDPTKSKEQDVTRNFDFDASLSLEQAQQQLLETILKNLTDEIFNSLFSDW